MTSSHPRWTLFSSLRFLKYPHVTPGRYCVIASNNHDAWYYNGWGDGEICDGEDYHPESAVARWYNRLLAAKHSPVASFLPGIRLIHWGPEREGELGRRHAIVIGPWLGDEEQEVEMMTRIHEVIIACEMEDRAFYFIHS